MSAEINNAGNFLKFLSKLINSYIFFYIHVFKFTDEFDKICKKTDAILENIPTIEGIFNFLFNKINEKKKILYILTIYNFYSC